MRRQTYSSVVIGIVTNNKDPEGLGRVKVRFPWLDDSEESHWARVCQFMTGGGRGMWIIPEIDDEVLVSFEHGDIHFPYVLGSLWNGVDRPPGDSGCNEDGQNNIRMFQSRAGHQIVFDDTAGGEKIHIHDGSTKNSVDIYNYQNSIHFTAATGDIVISAPEGTITMETTTYEQMSTLGTDVTVGKGYSVGVAGTTDMTAGAAMSWHTKTTAAFDVGASLAKTAGAMLNMQSTKVDMQGKSKVKFKSGIVNLIAGIRYGLTATKMSLDTGLLGYLRGVEHLTIDGGILAAVRGLILSMASKDWIGNAKIAISDIAGAKIDIIGGKEVVLNKYVAAAAPTQPAANPVKLWPPNTSSLKDFKQWAEENWNKLPDFVREPIESKLQEKKDDLVSKIDNPYLQAAAGRAFDSAMAGEGLAGIGESVYEGAAEDAQTAGQEALGEALSEPLGEDLGGALGEAIGGAVGGALGGGTEGEEGGGG